jgi:hypothetical protein
MGFLAKLLSPPAKRPSKQDDVIKDAVKELEAASKQLSEAVDDALATIRGIDKLNVRRQPNGSSEDH